MATYGDATEAQRITQDLNISMPFLSAILDGSPSSSTLNLWLQGAKTLDFDKQEKVLGMCRRLKAIQDEVRPLPLAFRNIPLWKELLEKYAQRDAQRRRAQEKSL